MAASRVPLPCFQTLLDAHAAEVLAYLVRRVGPDAADDCFQETWLAALRAYPRLSGAENLRGWVLTIARNKANDSHRAAARRPLPVADIRDTNGTVLGEFETDDLLWDEVRGLPEKQRRALVLRYVEDRDYAHIAQLMRTSEDAARRNVHEGVKKLRRART
jgi:RNA polymerase sigma factor (sigma-70 family)